MPVSLFSPLARGFGAWTGELHLAENDKGAGPSLPSLLQDDPYCHHSGVTVKPRAKSAVSAFSAKTARSIPVQETRDGKLQLPKTYITKKGAIVLFAAPDNPTDVQPSERDRLFQKRARRKLLKNRHSEYSNQIGSVQRLTQSVLSFGDQEKYDKETASVSDPENKVYLKFLKEEFDNHAPDKHSRPGGNIDMYLNDLLIRSGVRPATAIPSFRIGSALDLAEASEDQQSVDESIEASQPDLSVDGERILRSIPSPVIIRQAPSEGGRMSPSTRGKKLSAEKLASSLKSGGFLGRQTILEEIDSISEASSRPYTPATSMSRPSSQIRPYSRPLSGEQRNSPLARKSPLYENTHSELGSPSEGLKRESSFTKSNKLSEYSGTGYSSSILSGKIESEAGELLTQSASRSGSFIGQENESSEREAVGDSEGGVMTNSAEDLLQKELEIQMADEEIQGIVYSEVITTVLGETIEAEVPSPVLRRSNSQMGSRKSSRIKRYSRASSVQSLRKDTPQSVVTAGLDTLEGVTQGEEEVYLSEDAEMEEEDAAEGQEWVLAEMHEELPPEQMLADEISLLSGGHGQETFSFDVTVPETQELLEEPVFHKLQKQASMSSVRSDRPSTAVSSVSHFPESRPQSIARATSTVVDDQSQVMANMDGVLSGSKSSLGKSDSKSRTLSQGTESRSGLQQQMEFESEINQQEEEEVFERDTEQTIVQDELEDRPSSATSSHSGVGSLRAESPAEIDGGHLPHTEEQGKREEIVAQTEVLDEAATEPKDTTSTQPTSTEPLPDYLTEVVQPAERVASAAESVHRPPSSYTSSVTLIEDLPPEPAVTSVRITPLSSANRERMAPTTVTPDTVTPLTDQTTPVSPVPSRETLPQQTKPQPQEPEELKTNLPKSTEMEKEPVTTSAKHVTTPAPQPAEVKKEPSLVQSKDIPKATHMVESKPEEKAKPPPKPTPVDKKSKPETQKKTTAKPEKEKTPPKETAKPEKETKPKEEPKTTAKSTKPAKHESTTPAKPAKVSLKPETKEPEKPEEKTFTKVFDITNYENFEKENKKTPVVEKPPEPEKKPKEIKPESIVSDTKAEIARLFGTPPVKRESAREKKEKMRKELGARPKKPKAPEEPKPPKKTAEEKELEKLEQKVMEAIGGPTAELATEEGGGLTVEEMELEQQLLQEKLKEAEAKLTGRDEKSSKSKGGTPRDNKKKGKKKSPEEEQDLAKKREELRETKRLEKQKRLEEAKRLEEELKQKEEQKKRELEQAQTKTLDLDSDIKAMQQLAEEAERAEEDARQMLQETRRLAREEREKRRRDEQERKKEEAIRKKQEEKARLEAGRQREQEMLMRLATKEERMRIAEDERRRKEEEEERAMMEEENLLKQQKEEERLQKKKMEEEEARITELEREAEEEALAMLVEERDEALMKKREMEQKKRKLEEEEERKRKEYEAEQKRIEEARLKQEQEEAERREEEKRRLMELQRMEEEARERLKQEMARRREALLRRREQNIERRRHLDGLKGKQGITKPWVFSYYVHWPRETYELRMGGPEDKKKGGSKARSAPAKGRPTHT